MRPLPLPRRPAAQLALLLAAATGIHAGAHLLFRGSPYLAFRVGDEAHYHAWASAIAQGALSRETAFFTTPLFAYWLALVYRLAGDSIAVVQLVNVALGIGAVALTALAAARLVGPRAALLAGALVALARAVVFQEALPDKTSLVLFLTALGVYALARAVDRPTPLRWALVGSAAGLAALGHALLLVLVPAAALHLLLRWREDGARATLRAGAALGAGAALALAPATLHNALRTGELVLVCSNGGHNLYLGNHAGNLTGAYTSPAFSRPNLAHEEADFHAEAERRTGRAMGPGEVSRHWTRAALAEMAAAPGLTATRFLRKLRWTLGSEDLADTRTFDFYLAELPGLRLLPWDFGLVSLLGLLGAALSVRERRRATLVAFVALFALALSTFFVYGRYRLPLVVPLAILAAAVPGQVAALAAAGRRRALGAVAALAAILAVLVFGKVLPGLEPSFLPDYYNQGNRWADAGRLDLALAEWEKAITVRPGDHPALARVAVRVADVHLARGDGASARRVVAAALRARPGDPALEAKLAGLAGP